jgi:hypothetical protein
MRCLPKKVRISFLEKKKQKTFGYLACAVPHQPLKMSKVFCFFFSKKEVLDY